MSDNANLDRGKRYEAAVVSYLRSQGLSDIARIRSGGLKDVGDIGGLRLFAIECKDHAKPAYHAFVRQANQEALNAGKPFGVVVAKKRNAPVEESLVIMDLRSFTKLLRYMERSGVSSAVSRW